MWREGMTSGGNERISMRVSGVGGAGRRRSVEETVYVFVCPSRSLSLFKTHQKLEKRRENGEEKPRGRARDAGTTRSRSTASSFTVWKKNEAGSRSRAIERLRRLRFSGVSSRFFRRFMDLVWRHKKKGRKEYEHGELDGKLTD